MISYTILLRLHFSQSNHLHLAQSRPLLLPSKYHLALLTEEPLFLLHVQLVHVALDDYLPKSKWITLVSWFSCIATEAMFAYSCSRRVYNACFSINKATKHIKRRADENRQLRLDRLLKEGSASTEWLNGFSMNEQDSWSKRATGTIVRSLVNEIDQFSGFRFRDVFLRKQSEEKCFTSWICWSLFSWKYFHSLLIFTSEVEEHRENKQFRRGTTLMIFSFLTNNGFSIRCFN